MEENLVFGNELSIDIVFLEGDAILRILDVATRLSAAMLLDKNGSTYRQIVGKL